MASDEKENRSIEIGRYISQLRDAAKLTQSELARKITVSPARISRIEAGDASLTSDEVNQLLSAIGSDAAQALSDYMDQDWDELERPPFDHPNCSSLWTINTLLGKLRKLKADPELKSVFLRHIEMYEGELRTLAANLRSTDHSVAFVGSIGVGKSTAICTLTDLKVTTDGPLNRQVVLEAGAGGTTICEVHIKTGPQFGIIVEPRSEEAIRHDVSDFAEFLLRVTKVAGAYGDGEAGEGAGISKEVSRAIRNMAGLAETKTKDAAGRYLRNDPARELAVRYPDAKELAVQIISRMNLPRRDQRDIWYTAESTTTAMVWLQQRFTEINNGKSDNFSLPQRMEVVVPRPVLVHQQLNIRVVDTKGIDGAATRADLDKLFDEGRTLVVLCSKFNDAPEHALQQLLQRVKDAGSRDIAKKTAVLVLPRPDEAMSVTDNGIAVEDEAEGYELKRADVANSLTKMDLQAIPVAFFNAKYDDLTPLREFFVKRVQLLRAAWESRVVALTKTVDDLIKNHKQEQTAMVFKEVTSRLKTWVNKNRDLGVIPEQAQQELIRAIGQAHWRSVWASIRRRGEWYNLDYYYQIGYGARTVAAKYILKKLADFEIIVRNLLDDSELSAAHDMLTQVEGLMRTRSDEMLKKMEIVGRSAFEKDLREDTELWRALSSEEGSGYRDKVSSRSNSWFRIEKLTEKHSFVKGQIEEEWKLILSSLDDLFAAFTIG